MRQTLREILEREPYAPFEIVMSSGDRLRIEAPDLVILADSYMTYYLPRSNSVVHLRLNQVAMVRVDSLWT
jgi:hypothetical protein